MAETQYPGRAGRHKALIAMMRADDPEMECGGFWATVERVLTDLDIEFQKYRFLPDAFKVVAGDQTLEIHEAVVTHPPREETLNMMGALWFDFDSANWNVRLFLHRVDGVRPAEIDLGHWYYSGLMEIVTQPNPVSTTQLSEDASARP